MSPSDVASCVSRADSRRQALEVMAATLALHPGQPAWSGARMLDSRNAAFNTRRRHGRDGHGRGRGVGDGASPREQVDALTGAVEDLAGQFSLQPLLQRILRRAIALLGGDAGSISTVDEQAGTYHKEVDIGVECQEGRVFPLTEGATGAVVARRGPAVFDSYAEVPGGHVVASDRARLHATAAVPIEWEGSVIGACVVFSTSPDKRFSDDDVAVLSLFAKHAAIAIANARIHA